MNIFIVVLLYSKLRLEEKLSERLALSNLLSLFSLINEPPPNQVRIQSGYSHYLFNKPAPAVNTGSSVMTFEPTAKLALFLFLRSFNLHRIVILASPLPKVSIP